MALLTVATSYHNVVTARLTACLSNNCYNKINATALARIVTLYTLLSAQYQGIIMLYLPCKTCQTVLLSVVTS